jgi:predicted AAA+ superfamily ATPase
VIAITGLRRSGKSTLLQLLVRELVEAGRDPAEILLVNFEDHEFQDTSLDAALLDAVYREFSRGRQRTDRFLILLDEVQVVSGWARWVRRVVEDQRARVVVTGSSSKILEPELATVLTGRSIRVPVHPLSWTEFLEFPVEERRGSAPGSPDLGMGADIDAYLRFGGLPSVALARDPAVKGEMLRQFLYDVIYRDIVGRHGIRRPDALHALTQHLLANTARPTSIKSLRERFSLAQDAVQSWLGFLEESYLIRRVQRFSFKIHEQHSAPAKFYATDLGIRNAASFHFSRDQGWLAETAVHNALARIPGVSLYYFRGAGDRECDFVLWRDGQALAVVQVTQSLADGLVREREELGLLAALESLRLETGHIVTADGYSGTLELGARRLLAVSLMELLAAPEAILGGVDDA